MLAINYMLIIPWMAFFRLGIMAALVMLPLTAAALSLDFILLEGRKEVFFWGMNLLGATVAGIALSSYMYYKYENPDPIWLSYMIIELMSFIAIILGGALIAGLMNERRIRRLKRRGVYKGAPDFKERVRRPKARKVQASDDEDDPEEVVKAGRPDHSDEEEEPKFRMIKKS